MPAKVLPFDPNATPRHLSPEGAAFYRRVAAEYGISDAGGLALLTAAAEVLDRAASCRVAIEKDGLTTVGVKRRVVPHPLLRVEHAARAQMIAALRQLNLDMAPARDGPGRPPGSRGPW